LVVVRQLQTALVVLVVLVVVLLLLEVVLLVVLVRQPRGLMGQDVAAKMPTEVAVAVPVATDPQAATVEQVFHLP
jgi:hypothetical protein